MRLFTKKSETAETATETVAPVPTQSNGNAVEEIPEGAILTDEVEDPPTPEVEAAGAPEAWLDQTDPEDFRAPKRGFFFVTMRTVKEFTRNQAFDMAAALTYYSIFAIFPALIPLFSLIGLVAIPVQLIRRWPEGWDPRVGV